MASSGPPPPPPLPAPPVAKSGGLAAPAANVQDLTSALAKFQNVQRNVVDPTTAVASTLTGETLKNPNHDWLIYESVFNHPQFDHTADRQALGAYKFKLEKLRIVLAAGLSDVTLDKIRLNFFPGLASNAELRAACFAPWLGAPAYTPQAEAAAKVNRFAHMPYNTVANDSSAKALGTRSLPVPPNEAVAKKLTQGWSMWQTASRSCVMELWRSTADWQPDPAATVEAKDDKTGQKYPVLPWAYRNTVPAVTPPNVKFVRNLSAPILATIPYAPYGNDPNMMPLCAGVKTGVVWVGSINQNTSTSEKGTLEKDALAAALRSDYVLAHEEAMKTKSSPAFAVAHQVIILPELLTVTCTDATLDGGANDGFQLRDLSRLHRGACYFPPLSIPYVGNQAGVTDQKPPVNFDVRSTYFAGLAGDATNATAWTDYWRREFASRLGQAKAVLHLVYGLQPLTPNAQNFLLEYPDTDMYSVTRVVLRDILDMKLHSDWVATVYSDRLATNVSSVSIATLAGHFVGDAAVTRLLQYEATAPSIIAPGSNTMIVDSETFAPKVDSFGKTQYFEGTQLNFFPYTALHRGSAVASPPAQASAGPPRGAGWQVVLYTNAVWGLAHAQDYAATLNNFLRFDKPIEHTTFNKDIKLGVIPQFILDRLKGTKATFIGEGGRVVNVTDNDYHDVKFDFDANAQTIRNLQDTDADYQRAGDLHLLLCQWERAASKIIHDKLYATAEGRKRLRQFHGFKE